MNLEYCLRCGRVFAKSYRDICPACVKDIEDEYRRCSEYLRKNRQCNIQQLSEATEVSVRQITRFIREGRIGINQLPSMFYGCESCGAPIRDGNRCASCVAKLAKEIKDQQTIDARLKADSDSQGAAGSGAYQIGDRLKDR